MGRNEPPSEARISDAALCAPKVAARYAVPCWCSFNQATVPTVGVCTPLGRSGEAAG
jgi:hypothetical protein